MGTRNQTDLNAQVTNVGDTATIDAEALSQNLLTDNLLHHCVVCSANLLRCSLLVDIIGYEALQQLPLDVLHVLIGGVISFLLTRNGEQLGQLLSGLLLDCVKNLIAVCREQRELLRFLRCALSQTLLCLTQNLDVRLCCLEASGDDVLGRRRCTVSNTLDDGLPCSGLHHHDGDIFDVLAATLAGDDTASDDHLEQSLLVLLLGRESDPCTLWVLVISNKRDADATDSAGDRQPGKLSCS